MVVPFLGIDRGNTKIDEETLKIFMQPLISAPLMHVFKQLWQASILGMAQKSMVMPIY